MFMYMNVYFYKCVCYLCEKYLDVMYMYRYIMYTYMYNMCICLVAQSPGYWDDIKFTYCELSYYGNSKVLIAYSNFSLFSGERLSRMAC